MYMYNCKVFLVDMLNVAKQPKCMLKCNMCRYEIMSVIMSYNVYSNHMKRVATLFMIAEWTFIPHSWIQYV